MKLAWVNFIIPALFCTSCVKNYPAADLVPSRIEAQIIEQSHQIDMLQEKIRDINEKLEEKSFSTWASFSLKSSGEVKTVKTSSGVFHISYVGLRKYARGYNLYFKIGNPHNIIYRKIDIKISYGPKEALDEAKAFEVTLNKELQPAYWNKVVVYLANTSENDLEFIQVKINPTDVLFNENKLDN